MSTLIIVAGLPGSGKSYACRALKKLIPKSYYFDSDLFAKKLRGDRITSLADADLVKARLVMHEAKITKIRRKFEKYEVIYIDTCFDMPASRKLFYDLAEKDNINLIVIEMLCPTPVIKKRIFGGKRDETREVGTRMSRWDIHNRMKKAWSAISGNHYIVKSDKNVVAQLKDILIKEQIASTHSD